MTDFVFTMTTGRSGTLYLAQLLQQNLPDAECYHEILGWDRFGVDTPDVSHMTLFNSQGNVEKVQDFWWAKLRRIAATPRRFYVETSHLLMKAGLVENIPLLTAKGRVHLIALERDVYATILSFRRRLDFINKGNWWMWYLDPDYPRNLVPSRELADAGVNELCLWYILEIRARAARYERLLAGTRNLVFHKFDLDELRSVEGASRLLKSLGVEKPLEDIAVPPPQNVGTAFGKVDAQEQARIRELIASVMTERPESAHAGAAATPASVITERPESVHAGAVATPRPEGPRPAAALPQRPSTMSGKGSPRPVLMAWMASNSFGWGVLGLNLFCHWAVSGDIQPYMRWPISERDLLALGPLRRARIAECVAQSNDLAKRLAQAGSTMVSVDIPVIHALGNRDSEPPPRIMGPRNIGRMVFEETKLEDWPEPIKRYDAVVCASTWNADVLRARFGCNPVVIHEGVDPSLFHPAPKSGLVDPNRFHIFSGGKIEFRKAQDLVLLAFRRFAARHDDAVLVTAWHSPFAQNSVGFRGRLEAPLEVGEDKRLAIRKWVADNGINPAKVIDLGPLPNQLMPRVLQEMDCALQPSRAEGATNLVAMEAMACGLPVIVAGNTGVKDIIAGWNCLPLVRQGPVEHPDDRGSEGWGESEVEEIVEALETLYRSSEKRRAIGDAAAIFMRERTWERYAQRLAQVLVA